MAKKLAQIAVATQPKYLSMVKAPANRTGFKIVRSDNTKPDPKEKTFTPTRTRRTDSKDGMLYIALPSDFTEADAQEVMDQFGLEEDYEISMAEGHVRLVRNDMFENAMPETVAIRIDKNAVAYVSTTSFSNTNTLRDDTKIAGATLDCIEFEGHDEDAVKAYLAKIDIDITDENFERIDDEVFSVSYKKQEEAKRTDRIKLADGITARIYRTERNDLPEAIQRGVVEECYGNYGYGQLDFYAALADEMYTDAAYDANYKLSDILREVTLYSGLNLSSRVDLMNNALSQYSYYMTELMNSLPRSVVSSMTSDISKDSRKEDKDMTIEKKKEVTADTETEAKRSDDAVVADTKKDEEVKPEVEAKRDDEATPEAKADDSDKEETLKRSDVDAMIATAVAAALSAQRDDSKESEAKEPEAKGDEEEAETDGDDDAAKRSDDAIAKLTASVEALAGKVEELGDTSTVRYDDNTTRGDETGSVFKGALFGG
ncbi:MAG: hypothetical protein DRQ39_04075 [Gammaproteobacteria bacterium]|nr:MAG: hypothetical protein DRQ39_04075 [Gammaproteobacteria bacterium]